MIQLNLNRDYFTSYCTLGQLSDPVTGKTWQSIERPWVPSPVAVCGMKGKSCIPLGEYRLTRYSSDAFPNVYAISAPRLSVYVTEQEVPPALCDVARTRVLIHAANWASELRGCVAPGKNRVKGPGGLWMVQQSRDAMNELRNLLGKSVELMLVITSGSASNVA